MIDFVVIISLEFAVDRNAIVSSFLNLVAESMVLSLNHTDRHVD